MKSLWKAFLLLVAAALAGIVGLWIMNRVPRDIRYRDAGVWSEQYPFWKLGEGYVAAGFTNRQNWFEVGFEDINISSVPDAPPQVTLEIPKPLFALYGTWRVSEGESTQRVVCGNERGLAVWNHLPATQQPTYIWPIWEEPMAGPLIGSPDINNREYPRHKLILAFQESPDLQHVCIHPVDRTSYSYKDSHDGVAIIRDLETGWDVAELLHEGSESKIPLVAWSGDSQRLATYASHNETIRVWQISDQSLMVQVQQPTEWLALNDDGTKLFAFGRKGSNQLQAWLTVFGIPDGEVLQNRQLSMNTARLSPDQRYLAVGSGHPVLVLDAATLQAAHEFECRGQIDSLAFTSDGKELAAAWVVPNEIYGSKSGVKVWNLESGKVVLEEDIPGATVKPLGFCLDGRLVVGRKVFEPLANE